MMNLSLGIIRGFELNGGCSSFTAVELAQVSVDSDAWSCEGFADSDAWSCEGFAAAAAANDCT